MSMKAHVNICLSTDGDFCLNEKSQNFERFGCKISYWPISDEYDIEACFEAEKYNHQVRWLLETVLCEIHVKSTHYYLLKDLYDFFVRAMDAALKGDYHYDTIGGNYSGTEIEIYFTED